MARFKKKEKKKTFLSQTITKYANCNAPILYYIIQILYYKMNNFVSIQSILWLSNILAPDWLKLNAIKWKHSHFTEY